MTTIISLIGEQNLPNLLPILYLKPAQVILVYTSFTKDTAVRLNRLLEGKVNVDSIPVNAYDIDQTQRTILEKARPFTSSEILVNITGGTKLMSLAAYQAARELNAPLFYLQSEGKKTILYQYQPENGRYLSQNAVEIPPLITIADYLDAHLDDYQITSIANSSKRGYQFEKAVYQALQPAVDEICAGVKRLNTIDIDFVVRCGNLVGIIETKTGLKAPKNGIDQLNTAGGRAYLGTYTQKFFICDQTWGKNLEDLRQIAAHRGAQIVELPSFGQNDALSEDDVGKLQATVREALGCAR